MPSPPLREPVANPFIARLAVLSEQPRLLHGDFVFVNPATVKPGRELDV